MSKDWRLAESLKRLREQVNEAYPGRDKSSDGSIGDTAHSARKSDHNPNSAGVVCAIDIDEDLAPDIHSIEAIVSAIRASRDRRVKYIIYEGRITVEGSQLQQWKTYTGPNPHKHHAHISVAASENLYDDRADWKITQSGARPQPTEQPPPAKPLGVKQIRFGDKGNDVRVLQTKLAANKFLKLSDIDGDFGQKTKDAVTRFQQKNGLGADGIAGPKTLEKLG